MKYFEWNASSSPVANDVLSSYAHVLVCNYFGICIDGFMLLFVNSSMDWTFKYWATMTNLAIYNIEQNTLSI